MPAQGHGAPWPYSPAQGKRMNKQEIQKELAQLPKKWRTALAARIAAQHLPDVLYQENHAHHSFASLHTEKIQKGVIEAMRINIITESYFSINNIPYTVPAGYSVGTISMYISESKRNPTTCIDIPENSINMFRIAGHNIIDEIASSQEAIPC